MPAPLICLRPSFCRLRRPSAKASLAYLKFYDESRAAIALANILRASSSTATAASPFSLIDDSPPREAPRIRVGTTKDGPYERLSQDPSRLWPRMPKQENVKDIRFFRHEYGILQRGITMDDLEVTLRGMKGCRIRCAKLTKERKNMGHSVSWSKARLRRLDSGRCSRPMCAESRLYQRPRYEDLWIQSCSL